MNALKANKFRVGDEVEIVSLNNTVIRFGGLDFLLPIGSISKIEEVYDVDEVELQDGFTYDTADLKIVNEETNTSQNESVKDNVNNPQHYSSQSIECIVAMEAMLSPEEFIGYLRGNIFKYQWRYKQKNGVEDLKKAQWYQNKLIEKESV